MTKLARRALGFCLRGLQGSPLYRRIARRMARAVGIRQATEADSAQIGAQFFPEMQNPLEMFRAHVTMFVAERGSEMLGVAQLVRFPFDASRYAGYWLFSVMVQPLVRGMGIGQRLTETIIERARAEGAPVLSLLVFNTEARALRLYQKLGFDQVTIPALEEELVGESSLTGRRRIAMIKTLGPTSNRKIFNE